VNCPVCQRPTLPDYRPFCSRRCADVDLGRWLTGAYAIPADPLDDTDQPAPKPAEERRDPS
jgi:endogenous inhibitor of DNA gyrase (YacG/DUF329 family)